MTTESLRRIQRYIEIQLRRYWLRKYRAYQAGKESRGRFLAAYHIDSASSLPDAVRNAYDYYFGSVQARDFGNVYLYRILFADFTVYMVYVTTDGDDGWLELYDAKGNVLGVARRYLELVAWGDTATIRAQTETGEFPPSLAARQSETLWGK